MFTITPERIMKWGRRNIEADELYTLSSPSSVGQVVIINGVELSWGSAETPTGGQIFEGTLALGLTTDVLVADITPWAGAGDQFTAQEGNNLVVAVFDAQERDMLNTNGQYTGLAHSKQWSWRGLEMQRRPMTNVDMNFLLNMTTTSLGVNIGGMVYYQIAQLEPGDLGLGSILPVGARVVRGPQIPEVGTSGPTGVVGYS